MATYKKWTSTVLVNGSPEANVAVYVFSPGTTDQIPIYEDEGVTPITQPILTDSQGRYAFFVDVDTYPEIRLYLEKDGVDFSEANEDLDGVPVPGAGAGAGTFLELTDTPSSYVGRGGDVVLVKTTEDGIETQPWPVTGTTLNFFLSDDAADIGSYYYMYPTESGDGYSELTSPSLSTGDDQLLWAFVTEAGEPGVEVLALGAYTATLFLRKTGNKDVRVYWKLFKRDTGGTETEILQSAVSDYLTSDNSQYLISAYLNEDQVLDPTDRLVLKLYANVSGTGTDVTVTLTMEGDYDSRLTINVLSSAFNLDRLSDVTITSPTDNELLAYDFGSGKWTNQSAVEAGVLGNHRFLSHYSSASDAISDTPPGGTLWVDGTFDVATIGTFTIDKPMILRGFGWGKDAAGNLSGSKLVNTGADAVDSPVILVQSGTDLVSEVVIRDLAIEHEGPSSFAIEVNGVTRTAILDVGIDCNSAGYGGVHYQNDGYFARQYRTFITAFTTYGTLVEGNGGCHEFHSCHMGSSSEGSTALEIRRRGVIVVGGEYAGGTSGVGVRWYNPEEDTLHGGVLVGSWFEACDIGIEITGDTKKWSGIRLYSPFFNRADVTTAVRFDMAVDCVLYYPSWQQYDPMTIVHWTANATRCGAYLDYALARLDMVDDGAAQPYVIVDQALTDSLQGYINTVVPTFIRWNIDKKSPAWWDGSTWHYRAYRENSYTVSNVTTDRSFDANSTTLDEIADVLGTLISDLKSVGILA